MSIPRDGQREGRADLKKKIVVLIELVLSLVKLSNNQKANAINRKQLDA